MPLLDPYYDNIPFIYGDMNEKYKTKLKAIHLCLWIPSVLSGQLAGTVWECTMMGCTPPLACLRRAQNFEDGDT